MTGPSLLDPSSWRGRTVREVLCGSSESEGLSWKGVNGGLKNGAPENNARVEGNGRWNVVKSVARTSRGDNLAK